VPFRASFDCLWCGRPHRARGPDDLEGWAQLCPDCLGRAGDNGFLRFRLHRAIAERAAAARPATAPLASDPSPSPSPPPDRTVDDEEDWLLRRGRFAHGPIHDAAWAAELDAAGRWLDGLAIGGRIVELAPGSGWWTPLLATRGELTVLDTRAPALDRARERLVAHGLRAHLHTGDPWSTPEAAPADAVVIAFRLGAVPPARLPALLGGVRGRLRSGGLLAVIEPLAEPRSDGLDGSPAPVVAVDPDTIRDALREAGFEGVDVVGTGRFFVLARATA
jgi:SAM-dependent methyltransferase